MRSPWYRRHARLLLIAAGALALALAFLELGDEVAEAETEAVDHQILRSMRGDDGEPVGPRWFSRAMVNLSALGSGAVATVVVATATLYLLVARRRRYAALVAACGLGAWAVMAAFKVMHGRPRPTVITPIDDAWGLSFPSGHTMTATAVYLTLGLLISEGMAERRRRIFVMATAGVVALVVGCTRVYLGVHYPTDVLGGWLVGAAWALLCAAAFSVLRSRQPAEMTLVATAA